MKPHRLALVRSYPVCTGGVYKFKQTKLCNYILIQSKIENKFIWITGQAWIPTSNSLRSIFQSPLLPTHFIPFIFANSPPNFEQHFEVSSLQIRFTFCLDLFFSPIYFFVLFLFSYALFSSCCSNNARCVRLKFIRTQLSDTFKTRLTSKIQISSKNPPPSSEDTSI